MRDVLVLSLVAAAMAVAAVVIGYRVAQSREGTARLEESDLRAQMLDRGKVVQRRAFDRAAQAVGLWPYRVDRRAELLRHLVSLVDAADADPAPVEDDEPVAPLVVPRRPMSVPVAGPVPSPDVEDEAGEAEDVVDVYRAEGFL